MRLTENKLRQIILSEITRLEAEKMLKGGQSASGAVIVPLGAFMFVDAKSGVFQVDTAGGEETLTGRLDDVEGLVDAVRDGVIRGAKGSMIGTSD